ncbi:hypothetical protein B0H13DRAFT_1853679 [Mycena leptocephala]|nr:hypothetical protein B0H13DRAFT_1853679 [Mycena leptocephala]
MLFIKPCSAFTASMTSLFPLLHTTVNCKLRRFSYRLWPKRHNCLGSSGFIDILEMLGVSWVETADMFPVSDSGISNTLNAPLGPNHPVATPSSHATTGVTHSFSSTPSADESSPDSMETGFCNNTWRAFLEFRIDSMLKYLTLAGSEELGYRRPSQDSCFPTTKNVHVINNPRHARWPYFKGIESGLL